MIGTILNIIPEQSKLFLNVLTAGAAIIITVYSDGVLPIWKFVL
jgi:hypothetical protein